MPTLYTLSVFIHIVSAMVWIGGMFFLVLVLIPVLRKPEFRPLFPPLFHNVGIRYRLVGWVSLALLILTGIFNLAYRGYGFDDLASGRLFEGPFGRTLFMKLVTVSLILVISAIHDFWLGPTAGALIREDPLSPRGNRLRRAAVMMGRLNFVLALLVVFLAVMLVRGGMG
ncbi:MAG TPA: DUF4149 domain-containing protein [Thermodesulfobacteriota bacterium]|nr:DUF4149 domain-containing protein [Thermodesulfobacteriota bacterium]